MTLPRLSELDREKEWLGLPILQIIPQTVVDALFSEGRACAIANRDSNRHQWIIGGVISAAKEIAKEEAKKERGKYSMEDFWEACLDVLSESDATWAYSMTVVKRWTRAYERLHNVVDIEKYLASLHFETICVSGELAAAGLCDAEEALALAVTNGLTAEQLRDAYETGGHAPVWKQMSKAWGRFFDRIQNTPIWEEAKPHVEEIRKIIERGEK